MTVSLQAEMTFPSADSPELIDIPSFIRSPSAAVRLSRSDPAKSTILNFDVTTTNSSSRCPSMEFGRGMPDCFCVNATGGPVLDPEGVIDLGIPINDVGLFSVFGVPGGDIG